MTERERALREITRVKQEYHGGAAKREENDRKFIEKLNVDRFGPDDDPEYEQKFRQWASGTYKFKLTKKKPVEGDPLPSNEEYWAMRAQYQEKLGLPKTGKKERKYGDPLYLPYEHGDDENDDRDAWVRKFGGAPDTQSEAWAKWRTVRKYNGQYENTDEDKRRKEQGLVPWKVEQAQKAQAQRAAEYAQKQKQQADQMQNQRAYDSVQGLPPGGSALGLTAAPIGQSAPVANGRGGRMPQAAPIAPQDDGGPMGAFKRGEIGSGILQAVGNVANAPQAAYLNLLKNAGGLIAGKGLQGYDPSMTYDKYARGTTEMLGADPIGYERVADMPVVGPLATFAAEMLTDPTNFIAGGTVADLMQAGGKTALGSKAYNAALQGGEQLQQGKQILDRLRKAGTLPVNDVARGVKRLSNSDIETIISSEELSAAFEAEYGVKLPITKSGAREMVQQTLDKVPEMPKAAPINATPVQQAARQAEMPRATPITGQATDTLEQAANAADDAPLPVPEVRGNQILDNAPPEMKLDAEPEGSLYAVAPELRDTSVGIKRWAQKFYKYFVSGQAPTERISKAQTKANRMAVTLADRTQGVRNAGGTVDYIAERGLVNRAGDAIEIVGADGKPVKASWKSVMDSIPDANKPLYNEYRQNLHNIDRLAVDKPVLDKTAQESAQRVQELLTQHPEFAQYDANINNFNDAFNLEWLVDSGLISRQQYDDMKKLYPNYVPTYRVEWEDLKRGGGSGGGIGGNAVRTPKAVRGAKGATSEIVPLEDSFMGNYNRTVRAVRKNELYNDLIDWAIKNPDEAKTYARIVDNPASVVTATGVKPIDTMLDDVDLQNLKEVEKGVYQLTAYKDGKPITAHISKEVYDALQNLSGGDMPDAARFAMDIGHAATNPFKALTTGYSPLFVARNVLRDVPNAYINSMIVNPIKYARTMGRAIKEIATDSDAWKTFQALGGRRTGFYSVGKGFTAGNKGGIKNAIKNAVNATGEVTEAMPRFTEYLAGIEKWGDTAAGRTKAIQAAADITVNFSRSAPVTKVVDAYVPYLNAQVQGMDKFMRQLKKPSSVAKGAAIVGGPTLALYAWNKSNPHYKDLDNRTKDTYFNIPNIGNLDENGYAKTFIRIPKTREAGAIWSVLERFARAKDEGWEEAFEGYDDTLTTNFAISNPSTENIYASGIGAITTNRDFAGRTIVPEYMRNLDPDLQYDANTSEIAKRIGKTTNLSPKAIDYVMGQYGGFAADALQAATTGDMSDPAEIARRVFVEPGRRAFTADPLYQSGVTDKFYRERDAAQTAAASRNVREGLEADASTPQERLRSELDNIASGITELRRQEQSLLTAQMPAEQREKEIREIRQQMIDLARQGTEAAKRGVDSERIYPPGVSKERRATYDKLVDGGVPETTMRGIYAGFTTLKPREGNKTVTEKDKKEFLRSLVDGQVLPYDQYDKIVRSLFED